VYNPSKVRQSLIPILDFAKETIPEQHHSKSGIRVLATAGMRLLSLPTQTAILDVICHLLEQYPFLPANEGCGETARVISGEDEGFYGWLSLNYLTQRFQNGAPTLGFLDMGGASTQIAFSPQRSDKTYPDPEKDHHMHIPWQEPKEPYHIFQVPTNQGVIKEYPVFVTTYLGLGTNEARRTHVKQLLKMNPTVTSSAHIDDPCLPRGFTALEDRRQYGQPGYVKLNGLGQYDECRKVTDEQLLKESSCGSPSQRPCLTQPDMKQTFVGVSEYWYTTHDLLGIGGTYIPELIRYQTQQYCARSWDSTGHRQALQHGVDLTRLRDQCFKAAWIASILHIGFGLPEQTLPSATDVKTDSICPWPAHDHILGQNHKEVPKPGHLYQGQDLIFSLPTNSSHCVKPSRVHLITSDHVGQMQISWTLGYLLYNFQLNHAARDASQGLDRGIALETETFSSTFLWISVSILVAGVILLYLRMKKSTKSLPERPSRTSYASQTIPLFQGKERVLTLSRAKGVMNQWHRKLASNRAAKSK
jgi:hypothetical protein